jgi:hypothetical protein
MESNSEQTGLDLCVPIGVSGAFLTDKTQFSEIRKLFAEHSLLIQKLATVALELQSINHPEWLTWFEKRCQRLKLDSKQALVERERKLCVEKTDLTIRKAEVQRKLLQLEPRALDTCHTLVGVAPFLRYGDDFQESKGLGRKSPGVEARNSVIDCHLNLSNCGVCQELDDEFPHTDRPAPQFPENWFRRFDVKSFVEALDHSECSRLVRTMISKRRAKKRLPRMVARGR